MLWMCIVRLKACLCTMYAVDVGILHSAFTHSIYIRMNASSTVESKKEYTHVG